MERHLASLRLSGATKLLAVTPDGRMAIGWSGTMNIKDKEQGR